eukprot:gene693-385_t
MSNQIYPNPGKPGISFQVDSMSGEQVKAAAADATASRASQGRPPLPVAAVSVASSNGQSPTIPTTQVTVAFSDDIIDLRGTPAAHGPSHEVLEPAPLKPPAKKATWSDSTLQRHSASNDNGGPTQPSGSSVPRQLSSSFPRQTSSSVGLNSQKGFPQTRLRRRSTGPDPGRPSSAGASSAASFRSAEADRVEEEELMIDLPIWEKAAWRVCSVKLLLVALFTVLASIIILVVWVQTTAGGREAVDLGIREFQDATMAGLGDTLLARFALLIHSSRSAAHMLVQGLQDDPQDAYRNIGQVLWSGFPPAANYMYFFVVEDSAGYSISQPGVPVELWNLTLPGSSPFPVTFPGEFYGRGFWQSYFATYQSFDFPVTFQHFSSNPLYSSNPVLEVPETIFIFPVDTATGQKADGFVKYFPLHFFHPIFLKAFNETDLTDFFIESGGTWETQSGLRVRRLKFLFQGSAVLSLEFQAPVRDSSGKIAGMVSVNENLVPTLSSTDVLDRTSQTLSDFDGATGGSHAFLIDTFGAILGSTTLSEGEDCFSALTPEVDSFLYKWGIFMQGEFPGGSGPDDPLIVPTGTTIFTSTDDYLVSVRVLEVGKEGDLAQDPLNLMLVLIIPEDDVYGPLEAAAMTSLAICAGIIIVVRAPATSVTLCNHMLLPMIMCIQPHQGKVKMSRLGEIRRLQRSFTAMEKVMNAMSRYMSISVVKLVLVKQPDSEDMKMHHRHVSILFSDIEDFTSTMEKVNESDFMEQMGEYFHSLSQCIQATGGMIDKFIGDSIMAFWNAPTRTADFIQSAVSAALLMQGSLLELQEDHWMRLGKPSLRTRIGLHTGLVLVGNYGCPEKLDYTIVGDNVNLASRLEGLNKRFGTYILASDAVVDHASIKQTFLARMLGKVIVKGRQTPVAVHEILGLNSLDNVPQKLEGLTGIPQSQKDEVGLWNDALTRYFEQDFDSANRLLQQWKAAYCQPPEPADGNDLDNCHYLRSVATEYEEHSQALQRDPPSLDWVGEIRMTT